MLLNEWQPADLAVSFHTCYKERVLDMADDKDKYLDFPAFLGGSGAKVAADGSPPSGVDDDSQLVHTGS